MSGSAIAVHSSRSSRKRTEELLGGAGLALRRRALLKERRATGESGALLGRLGVTPTATVPWRSRSSQGLNLTGPTLADDLVRCFAEHPALERPVASFVAE